MNRARCERPRLAARDAVAEAVAGLAGRPGRTILTMIGTMLGVASLIATVGISQSAGNQIDGRFDAVAATRVTVTAADAVAGERGDDAELLPFGAEAQVARLRGVVAVAALAEVDLGDGAVSSTPSRDPTLPSDLHPMVVAVTPSLVDAAGLTLAAGRFLDRGDLSRRDRVVVVGADVARQFAVRRLDARPAVYLGDDPYTVVGVLASDGPTAAFVDAVLVPATTAQDRLAVLRADKILIKVESGAASLIAGQAPLALHPTDPSRLTSIAPPDPRTLRRAVRSDVNQLFLVLAVVSLLIGTVGIANVTLVTVLERTSELGLRRALGATPRHVALHVLCESGFTGLAGGCLGATVGIGATLLTVAVQNWTPVLDLSYVVAAPLLGALTGVVAGLYPAGRASRIEPVAALR